MCSSFKDRHGADYGILPEYDFRYPSFQLLLLFCDLTSSIGHVPVLFKNYNFYNIFIIFWKVKRNSAWIFAFTKKKQT